MTITAKLQFGNNDLHIYNREYLIVECKVHANRKYDAYHPISQAQTKSIELTVVAQSSLDLHLQEWYINQNPESGRLLLEMTDFDDFSSTAREILFEDAQCYSIAEKYNINDNRRRLIVLQFVANKTTIDDVDFT